MKPMKNQEILNALNEKIKAAEEALLYLNQTKAGLERVIEMQKSPAEEAYKKWWGEYPGTGTWSGYDETRWVGFQMGYDNAYKETVSKYQPTAQTPEQVDQGLRNAMKTAKAEGVFDEPEPKEATLYDLIADWWDEIFVNGNPSGQNVESLVDKISEWLPDAINNDGWKWGQHTYRDNLMRKLK